MCIDIKIATEDELGEGILFPVKEAFEACGYSVEIIENHSDNTLSNCRYLVIYGPMRPIKWIIDELSEMQNPPPIIVWFTEQIPNPSIPYQFVHWMSRLRFWLESMPDPVRTHTAGRFRAIGEMLELNEKFDLRRIFVFSETNQRLMRDLGLPVSVVPMGYNQQFGEELGLERDIDVVFLGSTKDKRRKQIINQIKDELEKRNINYLIKDGSVEYGSIYGPDRARILNRSKIMLNIMRQPWDDPTFRLLLAAPNGSMLLSETVISSSLGGLIPGAHFQMFHLSALVDKIEYYVHAADEREKITSSARDYVLNQLTMEKMVQKIIDSGCME